MKIYVLIHRLRGAVDLYTTLTCAMCSTPGNWKEVRTEYGNRVWYNQLSGYTDYAIQEVMLWD